MDSVLNTESYHLRLVFSVPRSGSVLLYDTLLSNLKWGVNRELITYNDNSLITYNDNSLNKLKLFNYYSGYIYMDTIFLHSHMNKFDIPFASKKAIFVDRKNRKAQAISLALANYSSIYQVPKDSLVEVSI